MTKDEAEQFEKAFDMHISGPVSECECGKVYWDSYNSGYDWSDGERERLVNNAIAVPHGIQRIYFQGRIYCMDCNCWHPQARAAIQFFREHQEQIAEWFRLEKQRLEAAAAAVPEIQVVAD